MLKKIFYLLFIMIVSLTMFSCGETTTSETTTNETTTNETTTDIIVSTELNLILPDLTGLTKSEMASTLSNLGISYVFQYETDLELDDNTFLGYFGDEIVGSIVSDDYEAIVRLSTTDYVLPDLTGLSQMDVLLALYELGVSFDTELITDNTIPNETFHSYGDGLVAGSKVPPSFTITVFIGVNSARLPDLTGMLKEEIMDILDEDNILYEFEYFVDDVYTEDTFKEYKDFSIGDFYESGVVTITLYKNTFTEAQASLIISKYVDGGNDTSDQAIELYNPTDADINLSDYNIVIYTNGSLEIDYTIVLPNVVLAQGETYVIANDGANSSILANTDLQSSDLVFDGNDAVQLCYKNGTYIDTIYNLGSSSFIMDEEVFIRDQSIVSGTRKFTANEWHGFLPTYTDVLGSHPALMPEKLEFQYIDRDFWNELGGMDLVSYVSAADGDTAYFTPGFLGDDRVRFLGTDTPETWVNPPQDWGLEAKAYTEYVLGHAQAIYIQSDPDSGFVGGYGRPLGLVWVNLGTPGIVYDHLDSSGEVAKTENLSGWILLNYHLILNGYSNNFYGSDSKLAFNDRYLFRWFQDAEKSATANNLGLHE